MLRRRQKTLQLIFICLLLSMSGPLWAGAEGLTSEEATRYAELEDRPLQTFTNVDLADYLQLRNKLLADDPGRPSPAEEIGHFARKSLGQTYRLNAVRWDLAESDCVVFTERCIAMACAKDWESYYRISERLRHKDGIVEYRNRNFHTLGDWVPNNGWLFEDITDQLQGDDGPVASVFTHAVRPKVFEEFPAAPGSKYTRIVFKGSDYSVQPEIRADVYIASDTVSDILSELQTGDVVLLMQASSGGHLGCNHLGVVVVEDGGTRFSSSAPDGVRAVSLAGTAGFQSITGFKFLRFRADAPALLDAELARLAVNLNVPNAADVDLRVRTLRQSRHRNE